MERHMNCEEIRERLLDLAGPATLMPAEMDLHFEQCAVCAAERNALLRTWTMLDEWKSPEPSPYFDSRLQARLREEKAAPQRSGILSWLGVRWQPALAGTLALAMVIAVAIFRVTGSQQSQVIVEQSPPSPAVYD